MLRVEHERVHVCALEAGTVPACATVRALEDAPPPRACVDRLRVLRVERQRGHACALQADGLPACAAVAALYDAAAPPAPVLKTPPPRVVAEKTAGSRGSTASA